METKTIHDKKFALSIDAIEIHSVVEKLASKINIELASKKVVFIGVLNGSFMFAADLLKKIDLNCRISFVKTASYAGTKTTGEVTHLLGLNENIKGKTIVLIEDIVDSGSTLDSIVKYLDKYQPSEIKIATLLLKPDVYKYNHKIDYIGFKIPNKFVVGYGLDYNGFGRNLESIYSEID